jgi:hypothetical protein
MYDRQKVPVAPVAARRGSLAAHERQAADSVLLVRPASFAFNPQTADSNVFQSNATGGVADVASRALPEFDGLHSALQSAGVRCCVVADTPEPPRPDAVFPNNWCSWHSDGTLVLYPLLAESRRAERREAIIAAVVAATGFRIRRRLDLSAREGDGRYLEGTGSLVLDRAGRVAYACRSPRPADALLREGCAAMDYEPVVFDATDESGRPYYHTNVMLWIGTHCAMGCLEAIAPAQREAVRARLSANRSLLEIDRRAVASFAGNMIELESRDAGGNVVPLLLMSATAADALPAAMRAPLQALYARHCVVAVPTIERVGGGSVRCMVAEVPDVTTP